jgi:hypothetical protein
VNTFSARRFIKGLSGICISALVRGLRFGPREFARTAVRATTAVKPLESRALRSIPVRSLEELLTRSTLEIVLPVRPFEDGMLPIDDTIALLSLLVQASPAEVLEIGTFMGHTTRAIAQNLPNAIVHTVDLPLDFNAALDPAAPYDKDDFHLIDRRRPGREFARSPCASRIRQHWGDTAIWDFSAAGGARAFFIDGSHTYHYCRNDSDKCFALCKGHGTFLWHDCDDDHPGVVRLLQEWRALGRDIVRVSGTPMAYWKSN